MEPEQDLTSVQPCEEIDPMLAVQIALTEVEYLKLQVAVACGEPEPAAVYFRDLSPFGR